MYPSTGVEVGAGVKVEVMVAVVVAVGRAMVTTDPIAGAPVTMIGRLDPPVVPVIDELAATPV